MTSNYLYSEWLVFSYAKSYTFALRIKGIQVDVGDYSERADGGRERKLREVPVCKLGFPQMTG